MNRKTNAEKLETLKKQYKKKTKYIGENYDRIGVLTPKGTKERIKELTGETINAYINRLVEEDLARREAAAAGPGSIEAAPDPDENDNDYLPFH